MGKNEDFKYLKKTRIKVGELEANFGKDKTRNNSAKICSGLKFVALFNFAVVAQWYSVIVWKFFIFIDHAFVMRQRVRRVCSSRSRHQSTGCLLVHCFCPRRSTACQELSIKT